MEWWTSLILVGCIAAILRLNDLRIDLKIEIRRLKDIARKQGNELAGTRQRIIELERRFAREERKLEDLLIELGERRYKEMMAFRREPPSAARPAAAPE